MTKERKPDTGYWFLILLIILVWGSIFLGWKLAFAEPIKDKNSPCLDHYPTLIKYYYPCMQGNWCRRSK